MAVGTTSTEGLSALTPPRLEAVRRALGAIRLRTALRLAPIVGSAAIVVFTSGVPLDREVILVWIVASLLLLTIGEPGYAPLRLLRDWVPFAVAFVAYDYTRGAADTLGMPVQVALPAAVDGRLFGEVPTVALQSYLDPNGSNHWWELPIDVVYLSYFIVPFVVAGVLWRRNRPRWIEFMTRYLSLVGAALATYVLLPTAPPWLASQQGQIGTVARTTGQGASAAGIGFSQLVVHKGQAVSNPVAALPSLHAAVPALLLVFFWPRAGWLLRVVLASYTFAMGFALVVLGEHYVFDVLLGWAYAVGVVAAVTVVERRFVARRRHP